MTNSLKSTSLLDGYEGNTSDHQDFASFSWHKRLLNLGVETHSLDPVKREDRIDTSYYRLFTLWLSLSTNLLPLVTGSLSTAIYGLSLRDASLTILFFTLLCTLAPAWATSLGPRTGLRQMVFSRYSFGLYGVALPALLNAMTLFGWAVVSCILAGQTLATLSDGSLSWTVGIVIIAVLSMVIAFFGYRFLHIVEQFSVVIGLVAIITLAAAGGSHLRDRVGTEAATSYPILSFASILAGYLITWTAICSDYTVYYVEHAPVKRLFWYQYIGLALPTTLLMILGAAIGASIETSDTWTAGYAANGIPGVLREMLRGAGGFGSFCTLLLALSLLGNLSATVYSLGFALQVAVPPLLHVPRYLFVVLATGALIPVAIVGAKRFFTALESFLGIVGYWSSAYVAIIACEHFIFRRNSISNYDLDAWNTSSLLPSGIAAIAAFLCSWALIIPSMAAVWYEGPIGGKVGDLGFEMGFIISGLLYLPFRWIEIKRFGRK